MKSGEQFHGWPRVARMNPALTERRQFYQIVMRHGFERLSCFAPSSQTPTDDKRIETALSQ